MHHQIQWLQTTQPISSLVGVTWGSSTFDGLLCHLTAMGELSRKFHWKTVNKAVKEDLASWECNSIQSKEIIFLGSEISCVVLL
jgi:hypothetical protein